MISMTLYTSHRVAAPGGVTPTSIPVATGFHSIPNSPREGEQLTPSASPPPSYVLSRAVSTVSQLYREWTVGLENDLSLQGLEDLIIRASLASRPVKRSCT